MKNEPPPLSLVPADPDVFDGQSSDLIAEIREHFNENRRLRTSFGENGRLYFERRLPFLTLYRKPVTREDPGADQLVTSQAAYLIGSRNGHFKGQQAEIVTEICRLNQPAFGAFLTIEVWTRSPEHPPVSPITDVPTPAFRLFCAAPTPRSAALLDVLEKHLGQISVGGVKAVVEQVKKPAAFPKRPRPLIKPAEADAFKCVQIGIEIEPVFQRERAAVFPDVLKYYRRKIGHALQHGVYHFAEHQTELKPRDYHSLGRRALVKSVWAVDAKLHGIAASFDFLREINPINIDSVWKAFRKSGYEKMPPFRYRPLSIDPSLTKRRLFNIPIEKIEDPTISYLFAEHQAELDRKLTMLSDRGTSRFVLASRQLYGGIAPSLIRAADTILEKIPAYRREHKGGQRLSPSAVAALAEKEIAYYRNQWSEADAPVLIRPDIIAGLMVSSGRLLISESSHMPKPQAEALLQHEVGTHLVTYFNGRAQKLSQLSGGLADYEQLQEGLAVLAEYLVGGLTPGRMRTLAARVVGAKILIDGGTFIDCFRLLCRYGFRRRVAFNITVRLYRGGGLTKDCIYLRGLNDVLKYLRDGGELLPLFVGKISTRQIPVIAELLSRKVVSPPRLTPRYLTRKDCRARLKELRQGVAVHELLAFDSE
jgi:uncharacterized protein (TIGR02421 family)